MAGYDFLVLNNAFTMHWKFQEIKDRPTSRAAQVLHNHLILPKVLEDLKAKYGGRDPYNAIEQIKRLQLLVKNPFGCFRFRTVKLENKLYKNNTV